MFFSSNEDKFHNWKDFAETTQEGLNFGVFVKTGAIKTVVI